MATLVLHMDTVEEIRRFVTGARVLLPLPAAHYPNVHFGPTDRVLLRLGPPDNRGAAFCIYTAIKAQLHALEEAGPVSELGVPIAAFRKRWNRIHTKGPGGAKQRWSANPKILGLYLLDRDHAYEATLDWLRDSTADADDAGDVP